jgi:hypothetical protein
MSKFKIKATEKTVIGKASFGSKEDFKSVKLNNGRVCLLHKVQADKLIAEKKATLVKDSEITEEKTASIRTKVVVEK